jgi:hypothetical protein
MSGSRREVLHSTDMEDKCVRRELYSTETSSGLFRPESRKNPEVCLTGVISMSTSRQGLKHRVFREFKEGLIITLYLWAVFGLLVLHKSMILAEQHIDFAYHGLALINALALAKVMLVARKLDLSARMKDAPLIYATLLKSAFFTVVLACFKIIEDVAIGLYRHQSFRQSNSEFGGGSWQGMLTLALLVFVTLIPFVSFGELSRVIGEGKLKKLFFHRLSLGSEPS